MADDPPLTIPNDDEVCILVINNMEVSNWKTVMVQHRWAEAYHIFENSFAESNPPATDFVQMQPNIGDIVDVYLAGKLAMHGVIITRQSSMTAEQHGVQVVGKSISWQLVKSSIRTQTGNFDGMNIKQIADIIAAQVNVKVLVIGDIDMQPFERMQVNAGEVAIDFLEGLARNRRTIIGSNHIGQLLLIGLHPDKDDGDAFIEGENILRINCIWSNEYVYQSIFSIGQSHGSDNLWGQQSAQAEAYAPGRDPHKSNLVVPQEHPDSPAEIPQRAQFEARWHDGTQLIVTVTVQGWLRANGDIYRVGNAYRVHAPSHMLENAMLKAKTVTFEQTDEEGTTTTLELVLPWFLNGLLFQDGLPSGPEVGVITPFDGVAKLDELNEAQIAAIDTVTTPPEGPPPPPTEENP